MKRIVWIAIGVAVVLLMAYKLYTNKQEIETQKQKGQQETSIQIPVEVATVIQETVTDQLKKTGTLVPNKKAVAYAQSSGNIGTLNFELGSNVHKGKVLAVVNTPSLQIDLQNAKAKEAKVNDDLVAYTELLEGGATTEERVKQLQLEHTNAKNAVAQLEERLADTRVTAPINGVITEKKIEAGVYVNVGTSVATIVDIEKLKVKVFIGEQDVYTLKEGDSVTVTTDVYPAKELKGVISFISPEADTTHSYMVEVTLPNSKEYPLKAGTFVYASFKVEQPKNVLLIPKTALLEATKDASIYKVEQNKAILTKITLGKDYGQNVAVVSGLSKGETVITSGQINLQDQSEIAITNSNKN